MNLRLQYGPDERPHFAFCESVAAGGGSPWHVRQIPNGEGLKLGGGITTSSLCKRAHRGWDLNVRITEHHLDHACPACAKAYREMRLNFVGEA